MATDVNVEVEMETVAVDEGGGIDDEDLNLRPAAQRVPRRKKRKGLRLSLILNAITLGRHTLHEISLFVNSRCRIGRLGNVQGMGDTCSVAVDRVFGRVGCRCLDRSHSDATLQENQV